MEVLADRGHRRMIAGFGEIVLLIISAVEAGVNVVWIMAVVLVRIGSDQRATVHHPSDLWQQFTNLYARHAGVDRLELTPNLGRSQRLEIKQVLMRRTTKEIQKNHRLRRARDRRLSFSPQHLRQRQPRKQRQTTDAHGFATS